MKRIPIFIVFLYQKLKFWKVPLCKHTPTCSNYVKEAYSKRNFFYATILSIWRLLRCNPLSRGGYDPVPEKKLRK